MKRRGADSDSNMTEMLPRERLQKQGLEALGLPDLLALVLGTGYAGRDVLKVSHLLMRDYGVQGLRDLESLELLREATGMPFVKACQLLACLEIGRRLYGDPAGGELPRINQPGDIYPLTREMWYLDQEQMRGFYLNASSRVLGTKVLSVGTSVRVLWDPATALRPAILLGATGLILVHNHPSGDIVPSDQDRQTTKDLAAAAAVMHIRLLDHLIVSKDGFTSMLGAGFMQT